MSIDVCFFVGRVCNIQVATSLIYLYLPVAWEVWAHVKHRYSSLVLCKICFIDLSRNEMNMINKMNIHLSRNEMNMRNKMNIHLSSNEMNMRNKMNMRRSPIL